MTERNEEKRRIQKALLPLKGKDDQQQQPRCYDTPYGCPWCHAKFESKRRIDVHVVSAHKFNCNKCVKEMKTWQEFLSHTKICEFSNEKIVFYDECDEK
jgi:hypothetical protein